MIQQRTAYHLAVKITGILLLLFFSGLLPAKSQTDSTEMVEYTSDYEFSDGIFLNFEQVKQNKPIPKLRIIATIDYNRLDFFDKILENEVVYLYDQRGMKQEVQVDNIWGYADKGKLYIHWNNEFNRIPYLGNVSHFVANKTIYQNRHYDNYSYNSYYYDRSMYSPTPTVEARQYILDFETGSVYDFDVNSVESVLVRDPELHDEYNRLRKRKKKQLMFLYLRKYNERNPLYLPESQ